LKSIREKSEASNNVMLVSLCDQTLEIIEKESLKQSPKRLQQNLNKKSNLSNRTKIKDETNILNSMLEFKHRPSVVENSLFKLYCSLHFRPSAKSYP
jgi:hypothetical protein